MNTYYVQFQNNSTDDCSQTSKICGIRKQYYYLTETVKMFELVREKNDEKIIHKVDSNSTLVSR